MLRLILILLFLLFFFIISIPLLLIEWVLGKVSINARNKSSLAIVQWTLKVILFLSGAQIIIKGYERLITDRAVLYVGNHRSFFDIIISYSMMPSLTGYIAKKEIKKVPIMYHWMSLTKCLFMDRENIKEGLKTILDGIENVKKGISVFIYPEGKRSHSDLNMNTFKQGSLKIATKADCPIIPVAFNNTSAIFEDQFPFVKKAKVIVEFGEPIYLNTLSEEDKKFIGSYTQKKIHNMLENNIKLIT